jgi:hypothetical protein
VRKAFLPAEPSWVDRAGVDGVVLVRGPKGVRTEALEQLFWNRSVDRVALLPGAEQVDHVHAPPLLVRGDGTLLLENRPFRRPLLMDGYAGTIRLADADLLGSSPSFKLWRPRGDARLSLYFPGRYSDGWLSAAGRLYVWPQRPGGTISGSVRLPLAAPAESPLTIRFRPAGGRDTVVHLRRGERRTLTFPVCSNGPWHLTFLSQDRGFLGGRVVSAQAGEPQIVPGPCRRRSASPAAGEAA